LPFYGHSLADGVLERGLGMSGLNHSPIGMCPLCSTIGAYILFLVCVELIAKRGNSKRLLLFADYGRCLAKRGRTSEFEWQLLCPIVCPVLRFVHFPDLIYDINYCPRIIIMMVD